MCMEDLKIGRNAPGTGAVFTSPNGNIVANQSNSRISLIFAANGLAATDYLRVWPQGFGGTFTGGITLTIGNPVQVVKTEDYGQLVQQMWRALGPAAGETLTVIEVVLPATKASELH